MRSLYSEKSTFPLIIGLSSVSLTLASCLPSSSTSQQNNVTKEDRRLIAGLSQSCNVRDAQVISAKTIRGFVRLELDEHANVSFYEVESKHLGWDIIDKSERPLSLSLTAVNDLTQFYDRASDRNGKEGGAMFGVFKVEGTGRRLIGDFRCAFRNYQEVIILTSISRIESFSSERFSVGE